MLHDLPPARVTFENRRCANVTRATRPKPCLFKVGRVQVPREKFIKIFMIETLDISFILALERGISVNRSDVRSLM